MKHCLLFLMLFAFVKQAFTQNDFPIHFEENSHFFQGQRENESYTFRFQNVSKIPISILTVSGDCECLTLKWGLRPVKPDSFGYIQVVYNPKKDSAATEHKISVTNSESLLPTELKIRRVTVVNLLGGVEIPTVNELLIDTDGDGVYDNEDDCPKEKGERKHKGCPPPSTQPLGSNEPDPNKFMSVDEQPKPINMDEVRTLIGYPKAAKDAGIQGQLLLRILVDENGNYVRHIVALSAHPILQIEVLKHVSSLKFMPAVLGGKPIKSWVNIPFSFRLDKEIKKE